MYDISDVALCRPIFTQYFGLLQDGFSGFSLLIGWIAVFPQNSLHQSAQVGANAFLHRPVDGYIVVNGFEKFNCNDAQFFISQHLYGAIVGLKGV